MGKLKEPKGLTINFAPSERQYELWKLLQPGVCPVCGGKIVQVPDGFDRNGNPTYKPQCSECGNRDLPKVILGGGAAGGGKSYLGSCWLVSSCIRFPDLRAVVGRKTLKSIKRSTLNTLKKVMREWGLVEYTNYKINNLENYIEFWNGSTITMLEMADNPSDPTFDRFGSSEYSIALIEEVSECSQKAVDTLYSRLRWNVSNTFVTPRMLLTTNPCMGWVRERFVQDDDGNPALLEPGDAYVPFTLFDNPDEEFRKAYQESLAGIKDKAVRERLLYGNWDFIDTNVQAAYWEFDGEKHLVSGLRERVYNPLKPLVLSFDFNVVPYMSALELQLDYDKKKVYVLREHIGNADAKKNNTPAFSREISNKLMNEQHSGGLIVTGDPAGKARSTQTEDGTNNYTIVYNNLRNVNLKPKENVLPKQPPQVTRLEFENSIFSGDMNGWTVEIDMRCRKFTEDLIYQRKNEDGTKNKKKVTDPKSGVKYEQYGHLSDCFDYAVCSLISSEWKKFQKGSGYAGVTTTSNVVYDQWGY